jgi:hypothetical protein
MPATTPGSIAFAVTVIFVPNQIAILADAENDAIAASQEVTEILPAVANRVAGVRAPADAPLTVALTVSVISIPEQIAIFSDAVDHADTWKSAIDGGRAVAAIE